MKAPRLRSILSHSVSVGQKQPKTPFVLLEMDFRWDSLLSKGISKAAQTPDLPGTFLRRCLYTQSTRRVGNRTCPTGETLGYLSLFQISVQRKRKKKKLNKTDLVYICFSLKNDSMKEFYRYLSSNTDFYIQNSISNNLLYKRKYKQLYVTIP